MFVQASTMIGVGDRSETANVFTDEDGKFNTCCSEMYTLIKIMVDYVVLPCKVYLCMSYVYMHCMMA